MKFAFLPNYFKKIGIACFICSIVGLIVAAISFSFQTYGEYVYSQAESYELGREAAKAIIESNFGVIQLISILLLLSMAFYMLAKEKVDDEYIDAMRWESLRLAIVISIAVAILFIILRSMLSAKAILFIQFVVYLAAFKIKKSKAIDE